MGIKLAIGFREDRWLRRDPGLPDGIGLANAARRRWRGRRSGAPWSNTLPTAGRTRTTIAYRLTAGLRILALLRLTGSAVQPLAAASLPFRRCAAVATPPARGTPDPFTPTPIRVMALASTLWRCISKIAYR